MAQRDDGVGDIGGGNGSGVDVAAVGLGDDVEVLCFLADALPETGYPPGVVGVPLCDVVGG